MIYRLHNFLSYFVYPLVLSGPGNGGRRGSEQVPDEPAAPVYRRTVPGVHAAHGAHARAAHHRSQQPRRQRHNTTVVHVQHRYARPSTSGVVSRPGGAVHPGQSSGTL